jgi:hypothetical protein
MSTPGFTEFKPLSLKFLSQPYVKNTRNEKQKAFTSRNVGAELDLNLLAEFFVKPGISQFSSLLQGNEK